MNLQKYLYHSGVDLQNIKSLLDFGCGSGRLLVGWQILNPQIELQTAEPNQLDSKFQSHIISILLIV